MKLCTIGYVPPKTFVGAQAFYENARRFKTTHPLMLFGEGDWPELDVRLKISPEMPFIKQVGNKKEEVVLPHKFAIHNILWFTALKMAVNGGYSHMLYIESDCRVGRDDWDGLVYDEYFGLGKALICGGTCATYNPANWNRKATERWCQLVADNYIRKNFPVATYGWTGAGDRHTPCVFPNGALSIISLAWAHDLFDLTQPASKLAEHPEPFDMSVGLRIGRMFEEDAFEVVGHLNTIYSGYGDINTTAAERKELLTSGRYCAVHQIKEEWQP